MACLGIQHADFQALPQLQQTLSQAPAKVPDTPQTLPAAANQNQAGAPLAGMLNQGFRHLAAAQADHLAT